MITDSPSETSAATAAPNDGLYDRLGGVHGIASAVDVLVERLHVNRAADADADAKVAESHAKQGHAGLKFLVTAWSVRETGGPAIHPGRDMHEAHAHLAVSQREFDIVATEIRRVPYHVNVPDREFNEFMAPIETHRSVVVAPPH